MTVEAYAKVNLTLAVLGERSDGYHALRSLVVPISLNDTIDLESRENAGSANFPSGSQGDLCGTDNLCFKAARALVGARGLDMRLLDGLSMRLTKRIPVGGGLGGGSADAAAVLVALNRLWGLGLSRRAGRQRRAGARARRARSDGGTRRNRHAHPAAEPT